MSWLFSHKTVTRNGITVSLFLFPWGLLLTIFLHISRNEKLN